MLISGSNQENGQAPSKLNGFTSRIFQTLNSSILRILWMRTSQHAKEEIVKKCILKQVKGWWQFSKASDQPPDSTMTSNTMMTKRGSDCKDILRRRSFNTEMTNLNMKSHNLTNHNLIDLNMKRLTSTNLINFSKWVWFKTINKMKDRLRTMVARASSNMMLANRFRKRMLIWRDFFHLNLSQKLFKTKNFPSKGIKITSVSIEQMVALVSFSRVIIHMIDKDNLLQEDFHLVPNKSLVMATTFKRMMDRDRDFGNKKMNNQVPLLFPNQISMDKIKLWTI
jgi:hypothetical protein